MTETIDPLTPPDCDLRGMEWMPLFGGRLFMSDFEARASDEVFRASLRLWWMAWQQVPAASLPDDDAVLCKLAGLGRDIKTWRKLRAADALHGFVACSDGRLYHRLLAAQAREAWDRRVRERDRKAAYRAKYTNGTGGTGGGQAQDVPRDKDGDTDGDRPQDSPGTETGLAADRHGDVRADRTGQDRTGTGQDKEKEERSSLRSDARGCRLPDGWNPGEEGAEFARSLNLDPSAVLARFGDYWRAQPGARGRKTDWVATWRKWCRTEAEAPRARGRSPPAEAPSKLSYLEKYLNPSTVSEDPPLFDLELDRDEHGTFNLPH